MLKVHANRNYAADQVRHLYLFPEMKSSVSGQYGEINFPTLVNKIKQATQDQLKNIIFIDTRIDSHFEINGKTASLKLPEGDDILENSKLTSAEIVEKEKALSKIYTIGSKVLFIPKKDERNQPEWEEEIQKFRLIKDCIEEANYRYYRFALDEHGPLTNAQVDEFLKLIEEDAWFHINSIVGGASAATLAVMKDIWNNASKDTLEIIIGRCPPAKNFLVEPKTDDINAAKKLERAAFLREFHRFTLERAENQSWSDWKELQSSK